MMTNCVWKSDQSSEWRFRALDNKLEGNKSVISDDEWARYRMINRVFSGKQPTR